MSVAIRLGVDNMDGPTMTEARSRWSSWVEREPALAGAGELRDLRAWTRTADAEKKDCALRSLAKLGSARGGDDAAAITALTWALVPGASTLAHRMSDLSDDIDELVASHLWIAAKTFEWERRRSTAASILRDTLRGVQAELGVGDGARRQDRVWVRTLCVEPSSPSWQHRVEPFKSSSDDASAELLELLEAAADVGVITSKDRDLLIDLALASDEAGVPGRRGRAGLMTPRASEAVALRWGVSSRTIRRRAARAIESLQTFSVNWVDSGGGPDFARRLPISA